MTHREAIRDVLVRAGEPRHVTFVTEEIARCRLYVRQKGNGEGRPPTRKQVQARVSKHLPESGHPLSYRPSPGMLALIEWREPSADG
ncbi:MAG: hypothetical protein OXG79_09270 [Chloroflexi bacterium]|nr:hypothetical protein [Chloroflexota bacterium]